MDFIDVHGPRAARMRETIPESIRNNTSGSEVKKKQCNKFGYNEIAFKGKWRKLGQGS